MLELPEVEDDGLYIREAGDWSRDKHHFLERYIDAFVTSMHSKSWTGLCYVDLFCGPGVERYRDSGSLGWGSPLIAAHAKFDSLHFCDLRKKSCEALTKRLGLLGCDQNARVWLGDANTVVHDIIHEIPSRSLSLTFLDPTGLHLRFDTLHALSQVRADLIIYFPDRVDIQRNVYEHYFDNPESNLDRVMGANSDWRVVYETTHPDKRPAAMRDLYCEQIKTLGYSYFEFEGIPSEGRRLYWLVFCSKHEAGARIWRNTSEKKPSGQRTFNFRQDRQDR